MRTISPPSPIDLKPLISHNQPCFNAIHKNTSYIKSIHFVMS